MLYAHIDPIRWAQYAKSLGLNSETGLGPERLQDFLRTVGTQHLTSQLTGLEPAAAAQYWPLPAAGGLCIRLH